jgi:hypothetical protein
MVELNYLRGKSHARTTVQVVLPFPMLYRCLILNLITLIVVVLIVVVIVVVVVVVVMMRMPPKENQHN